MADAVLLIVMAMILILFSLQEFLVREKRAVLSLDFRATTMMVIGMYLTSLYVEMGSSGGSNAGAYMPPM